MKLSKAQLEYIQAERSRMTQRLMDIHSFGDDVFKSEKLSAERSRIYYNQWFFNHILNLHKVEVEAEKEPFKQFVEEMSADGVAK